MMSSDIVKKIEQEKIKEPKDKSISKWKDLIDIVHSIFVILAIICAGYWFFKQGEIRPRADIFHEITYRNIYKGNNWVHVLINIKNIGKTPIVIEKGTVWIQQVTPLADKFKTDLDSGVNIINKDYAVVWPNACNQEPYKRNTPISIEPGETDRKSYEFIVPRDVTTIKVYSYFENPNKSYDIGWKTITIYDMK